MPRSVEDIVRDMLGRQALQIAQLLAENERLAEALAKAEKPPEPPTP